MIDERFRTILDRAREVLEADERVLSVEPGGSVGADTADQWSDLDIEVVAHADRHEEFLADWPRWLATITPTVFARTQIAPFIINALTPDGLTVDLVIYKGEAFSVPPATRYGVGMLSSVRYRDLSEALEYAVAEQLRGLAGPFISLLQREEHVRHLTGVPHVIGLLTTVFLAEIDAPPPGKHWNATFTPEQRAAVAALPAVSANREALVQFGLGLAELLVTRARPLFVRRGVEWPTALAEVAANRLRTCLGLDTHAWLYSDTATRCSPGRHKARAFGGERGVTDDPARRPRRPAPAARRESLRVSGRRVRSPAGAGPGAGADAGGSEQADHAARAGPARAPAVRACGDRRPGARRRGPR